MFLIFSFKILAQLIKVPYIHIFYFFDKNIINKIILNQNKL